MKNKTPIADILGPVPELPEPQHVAEHALGSALDQPKSVPADVGPTYPLEVPKPPVAGEPEAVDADPTSQPMSRGRKAAAVALTGLALAGTVAGTVIATKGSRQRYADEQALIAPASADANKISTGTIPKGDVAVVTLKTGQTVDQAARSVEVSTSDIEVVADDIGAEEDSREVVEPTVALVKADLNQRTLKALPDHGKVTGSELAALETGESVAAAEQTIKGN